MATPWLSGPGVNSRDYLEQGLSRLAIQLPDACLDSLLLYCRELQKWSRRINLIAKGNDEKHILEVHFMDALTLLPTLSADSVRPGNLLDVGSGAGFPGLVLAAVLPEHRFTLVEPRKKRVTFLRHIIRTLGLKNVAVHDARVEKLTLSAGGEFSHITGRAVADPERFLQLVEKILCPTTRVILMLASRDPLESLFRSVPNKYQLVEERTVRLPYSGAGRLLAVLTIC